MFHAFVTRFFITIMVFVCINLSRMWFLGERALSNVSLFAAHSAFPRQTQTDGLRRYHWRSLTPPTGFTYLGTVSRSGKLSKKLEPNVNRKLDKVCSSLQPRARVCLTLATVM